MSPTPSRLAWLDSLRVAAGLSMVVLHCTADPTGGAWIDYSEADRVGPLMLRMFAYVARTELFIIIAFFLLFLSLDRRDRSYKTTIQEQAMRLLIPFVVWTVFYAAFNLIKASQFGYLDARLAELTQPEMWLSYLLLGNVKYHMHFLPTLFAVVLAYPLMRFAISRPGIGITVFCACLFVRWYLEAFFYAWLWDTPIMPYIARSIKIATHIGYGTIAASASGLWRQQSRTLRGGHVMIIATLGTVLLYAKYQTTLLSIENGRWIYNHIPGFIADFSMPALLFFGLFAFGDKRIPETASRLAKYSFGLYLCHPIFLDLIEITLQGTALSPIAQVCIKMIWTLMSTSAFVFVLSKFKVTAWAIGLGKLPTLFSSKNQKGATHVA